MLIGLRTAYAYNWFDVGPALPGIGTSFSVGPDAWGALVGIFLLGAGVFQVPAGLLARRYGARPIALAGAAVLAAGALASGVAPTFLLLAAGRFAAGVGAGLFFAPAIGLVGAAFPPGERGVPVGAFSSAFNAGAAAGIFGTALAIPFLGWRGAIVAGALGLAVLTVVAAAVLPRGRPTRPAPIASWPSRRTSVLRLPGVWAIGVAFVGFEGAAFATGQFVVPFGESVHGWAAAVAGAVGVAFVLPSVIGGPVGGVAAERGGRPRAQLAAMTALGAGAVAVLPFAGVGEAVAVGATFSFAYGYVYAVMYVLPHRWPDLSSEEIPLAIGLFNAVQLAGGAAVALAFGVVVAARSYAVAWPFAALVQVVTLFALFALPVAGAGRRLPSEAPGPPPTPAP